MRDDTNKLDAAFLRRWRVATIVVVVVGFAAALVVGFNAHNSELPWLVYILLLPVGAIVWVPVYLVIEVVAAVKRPRG